MKVNRQEQRVLQKALKTWEKEGELSADQAQRLRKSLSVSSFDWQALSYFAFGIAVVTGFISALVLLADDWLWDMLEKMMGSPEWLKSVGFTVLSGGFYFLAHRVARRGSGRAYSSEALLLLGVLATSIAVYYLGLSLNFHGDDRLTLFFLLATLVYAVLAWRLSARLLWFFAMVSLVLAMGDEAWYLRDAAGLHNLNLAACVALGGGGLIGLSWVFRKQLRTRQFYIITLSVCLTVFLGGVWLMSLYGPTERLFPDWDQGQPRLLLWTLLLLGFSVLTIRFGIQKDHPTLRRVGLTFLFLNLLTRYLEYAWDPLPSGVFFLILAVFFWLIGRYAERIWATLGR